MRPRPLQPLPELPGFVAGLSVIRGRPTPIVDLCTLLGDDSPDRPTRVVTVKTGGGRWVGLQVAEVIGLRPADELAAHELPALLGAARASFVDELRELDGRFLLVLKEAALVSAEVWDALGEGGGAR